ncbi:alkylation response protein AidB-like acyl-CoA dehydrogenase [Neorhizobium galegae]|uniref:acyl-CoA dehydrogenase family protein n=1 Tax=Neorhizobium galegae TaxID=399 RepID=UPI001AE209F6|nr:acyl-CoA dehydrogenase family protein [Neorhizobium galegae]MBP2548962.1 alkylation response protein AidB-like acyl-CoA dehydrogenase [Neorhizobium galegae]
MQNVFRLPVHSQQDMGHPSTEEEALAAAREFARRTVASASPSEGHTLPYRELEWIAHAGLLGVTVPAEFGGPDLANASLADIVAIMAEANPLIGESLKSHFTVLETLRIAAAPAQQKFFFAGALAGEQFCAVPLQPSNRQAGSSAQAQLSINRSGCSLTGELRALLPLFADWIAVSSLDGHGQSHMALVHRDTDEISFKDMSANAEQVGQEAPLLVFADVHIAADSILTLPAEGQKPSTPAILSLLLDSAIDLGIARRILNDLAARQSREWADRAGPDRRDDEELHVLNALGRLAAGIEGLGAMVERAGLHLDIAQVDATVESENKAWLSATSANILSGEIVREAIAAILDLQGPSSLPAIAHGHVENGRVSNRHRAGHRQVLARYLIAASNTGTTTAVN